MYHAQLDGGLSREQNGDVSEGGSHQTFLRVFFISGAVMK